MSKYVKKLGSDKTYKRPKVTYQEKLSAEEIEKKLQGYEKVENIADVPLNTHIRYFTINPDGSQIFRTGGFLHNKQNADTYVMLSNGKTIWSVQVNNSIFFRKLSQKDEIEAIHEMYKKKLEEKDKTIEKLKKYIKLKIKNDNQIENTKQPEKGRTPDSLAKLPTNYSTGTSGITKRSQTNQSNRSGSKYIPRQSISKNTRPVATKMQNFGSKYHNSGSKTSRPAFTSRPVNAQSGKKIPAGPSKAPVNSQKISHHKTR